METDGLFAIYCLYMLNKSNTNKTSKYINFLIFFLKFIKLFSSSHKSHVPNFKKRENWLVCVEGFVIVKVAYQNTIFNYRKISTVLP